MRDSEYAGWITRYKLDRPLCQYEEEEYLDPKTMGATPFVGMGLAFSGHIASTMYRLQDDGTARDAAFITADWIFLTAWLLFTLCVIKFIWLKDFFCYTHYPIRFNRKNRMVYVFRHNAPGGVLTIPWDSAYFYIGRSSPAAGSAGHYTFDLRCNVLDDQRMVRDTFAVGMDGSTSRGAVLEHWEMVRR